MSTQTQREAAVRALYEGVTGNPWDAAEILGDDRERYYGHVDEIIAAYEQAAWQSIETAPAAKDAQVDVIVFGGRYTKPTVVGSDGEWWRLEKGKIKGIPTHWRPTPAPPKEPSL